LIVPLKTACDKPNARLLTRLPHRDGGWQPIEVVGVRNDAGPLGEDAVAPELRTVFVPRSPEVFAHDADGNLTQDGRWAYTRDGENRRVAIDDWVSSLAADAIEAAAARVHAFPLERAGRDSAVLVALPPGLFTVVIEDGSRTGAQGEVLVEVYLVPAEG
jgi:hypothetical protein